MKVGIIGCGAIGNQVAIAASNMAEVDGVTVFDIDPDAAPALAKLAEVEVAATCEELVASCDVIVEAANKGVVQTAIKDALKLGKRVILLTVGALADDQLRDELLDLARANGGKIHVPSGAIMGIDGLMAGAETDLKSVTLVTTKPPTGLGTVTDKWKLLFAGTARDAVEAFPKNVNVAATLSLAGLGFDDTYVQVAADPLATRNSHKIIVEGAFGRAKIEVENLPSPNNPATSYLASLSAIATLRRIVSPLEIGT